MVEGQGGDSGAQGGADSEDDFLTLTSTTLVALTSFLDEQAAAQEALASLTAKSYFDDTSFGESEMADDQGSEDSVQMEVSNRQSTLKPQSEVLTVDRFKTVFKEDWQLSQFWYTQDTALRLTQAIKRMCTIGSRVAFMCCPTGYVAFKKAALPTQKTILLEYDARFSVVAGEGFVHYDLNEPLAFPQVEELRATQDVVVVDPPFHSEATQKKIATTILHILRPDGRLVLLTGLVLSPLIKKLFPTPPFPKLCRRNILIEHDGVGRLATPYGCWVGAAGDSKYDDLDGFGGIIEDET